jgi:uncharacterized membrane protein YphA (DoxX/SURF4 family)
MITKNLHKLLTFFIATVWIINGLFCKVLNQAPRHQQIVENILNLDKNMANTVTNLIGLSEIVMAIWILSGFRARLNAIVQIIVVAIMNMLEFILVPDLLLWGKFNSIFALVFVLIVYLNEFIINKKKTNAVIS